MRHLRACAALLLALWAGPCWAAELTVHFLDVGQGDSALLLSPTGKSVLIDGGPPEAATPLAGRLKELLHGPIDLVVMTHPHLDHLGGLHAAVEALGAQLFFEPGFDHPSPQYGALLRLLSDRQIPLKVASPGRQIDLGGGATMRVLWPRHPFLSGTRSDVNANSVVLLVSYGEVKLLLPGDLEPEGEAELLAENSPLAAQLLKVAHHGGRYSSTRPFLAQVKPRIAVISVGAKNDYGHPTHEAIERLRSAGATVYRTDLDGEVVVSTDGQSLKVSPTHPRTEDDSHAESAPSTRSATHSATSYVASRRSDAFHRADCPAAAKLAPHNALFFSTRRQALAAGKRPARDCNP